MDLYIIEAPGKIDTIKKVLRSLGIENPRVIATRGRLLDLPKDAIGIDSQTFEPIGWEPINPHRVDDIKRASKRANKVYIMTDDDTEGEVIAYHVLTIIDRKDVIRIKPRGLSKKDIKAALNDHGSVDTNRVKTGIARRSLDRIIGYALSSNANKDRDADDKIGFVGRIQTPLLAMATFGNPVIGWMKHNWPASDGNEPYSLTIPVKRSQLDVARELRDELAEMSLTPIKNEKERTVEDDQGQPWDGGEALYWISHELNEPVKDVSQAMQRLYESGKISYPRSDSRRLSEDSITALNRIAHKNNLPFNRDRLSDRSSSDHRDNVQDAHEAPHPLTDDIPLHVDPKVLDIDEKVLVALTNRLLDVSLDNIESLTQEIDLGNSSELSPRILELLKQLNVKPTWNRKYKRIKGISVKHHDDQIFNPGSCFRRREAKSTPRIDFRKNPNDRILLHMLLNKNLGRPSTFARHIDKASRKYMGEYMAINSNARKAIAIAQEVAPALLMPDIAAQSEKLLEGSDKERDESVSTRVQRALNALEINLTECKQLIKQAETIKDRELIREQSFKYESDFSL